MSWVLFGLQSCFTNCLKTPYVRALFCFFKDQLSILKAEYICTCHCAEKRPKYIVFHCVLTLLTPFCTSL